MGKTDGVVQRIQRMLKAEDRTEDQSEEGAGKTDAGKNGTQLVLGLLVEQEAEQGNHQTMSQIPEHDAE